ncbi:MAG: 3-isopropylmalate dehydratase small subunit [Synechococcaceae cyanobacterium RM1_1_27]|nr:3-isopropylmalate dehydratase small subunit [Synechococcaceae cyanobacterium SM2_3_2]NJO85984.1 3-isopropylmalate dehydratase small subunit [Synechococcaceae cyanobacterium RM1_1_27]
MVPTAPSSSVIQLVQGRGIPLVGNDIDTDRIIPARFLRCITFDGLGEQAFADDRAQLGGQHPFDLPQYQGSRLLVVNGNFGCGSSREHAPQALQRWGIQAVIGESFAEIFFGNCVALGIPCVMATPSDVTKVQQAIQQDPTLTLGLDLAADQLTWADQAISVSMPSGAKQMMLSGTWDACGQLLAQAEQIKVRAAGIPYMQWQRA